MISFKKNGIARGLAKYGTRPNSIMTRSELKAFGNGLNLTKWVYDAKVLDVSGKALILQGSVEASDAAEARRRTEVKLAGQGAVSITGLAIFEVEK